MTAIRVRNSDELKKLKSLLKGVTIYPPLHLPGVFTLSNDSYEQWNWNDRGKLMTDAVCERLAITKIPKLIKVTTGSLYVGEGMIGNDLESMSPVKNIDKFIEWSVATRNKTKVTTAWKLCQTKTRRFVDGFGLEQWKAVGTASRYSKIDRLYRTEFTVPIDEFLAVNKTMDVVDRPDFIYDMGEKAGFGVTCYANGDVRFGCTRISLADMRKIKKAL